MAAVVTRDIVKTFGEITAVNRISLTVADGEFMVLLGPSGCGKTTFLRIICGLEQQTSGDLLIGGDIVNDLPPRARGVAMMFQSYGLYPHFTVRNNIAFPLRTQRVPRAEIDKKVEGPSQLLSIAHLLDRRPRQLSGGERQRVALARALVREPTALLLDEPLSNLDAKLRTSARQEIKNFQQRVGLTTIYVTHDQVEAMGMGDRIAVIDGGQIRQVGTPTEIYNDPADLFVATFVGSHPDTIVTHNDSGDLRLAARQFPRQASTGARAGGRHAPGRVASVRRENRSAARIRQRRQAPQPPLGWIIPMVAIADSVPKPVSRFQFILDRRDVLGSLMVAPAILYVLLLVGVPFLMAVYYSLSAYTIYDPSWSFVGLSNFEDILEDPTFRQTLYNTFVFTFGSQILGLVLGKFGALLLLRPFPGRKFVRALA